MSQFTIEHITGQVDAYHNTVFHLLNTPSGIRATAMRTYVRFIHHDPLLPSFPQIVPINVGTRFDRIRDLSNRVPTLSN